MRTEISPTLCYTSDATCEASSSIAEWVNPHELPRRAANVTSVVISVEISV